MTECWQNKNESKIVNLIKAAGAKILLFHVYSWSFWRSSSLFFFAVLCLNSSRIKNIIRPISQITTRDALFSFSDNSRWLTCKLKESNTIEAHWCKVATCFIIVFCQLSKHSLRAGKSSNCFHFDYFIWLVLALSLKMHKVSFPSCSPIIHVPLGKCETVNVDWFRSRLHAKTNILFQRSNSSPTLVAFTNATETEPKTRARDN